MLATIGRAEKGETADVNYMEVLVDREAGNRMARAPGSCRSSPARCRRRWKQAVPTVVFSATQPIQMRVEELISGVRATLALKVYGPDLATLDRLSNRMKQSLSAVTGVADLSLEANQGKPQIVIRVDRDAAARYGVNADEVLELVQAGIGGKPVSTLLDGTRRFDIAVRFESSTGGTSRPFVTCRCAPKRARLSRCRGWPR